MLLGLGHVKRNKRARQSAACGSELARYEMKRDVLWPAVTRHATNIALGCLELLMGHPLLSMVMDAGIEIGFRLDLLSK